jgi:uncharacterized protein YodC (DUF2158 family)
MKPGDLVKLKSDGPVMTVASQGNYGWICLYFVDKEIRQAECPDETLVKVDPAVSTPAPGMFPPP